MCVIVALDANKIVDEETLRNCWVANDDGAGFMYAKDNELIHKKGLMTWEDFKEAWKSVPVDVPRVVHFRIKTHGKSDERNTHPFLITYRLGFVHNGVINGVSHSKKGYSDTWHFNEEFLKPMARMDGKFLEREYNTKLISSYIGNSKLVFLNHRGDMTFVNKHAGIQAEEGIWFSNNSYKSKAQFVGRSSSSVSSSGHGPYQTMRESWQDSQPRKRPTIPEWASEGQYVRVKVDMPSKGLKRGDLVYVDNTLLQSLEVVLHDWKDSVVVEKKFWVNLRDVEEINFERF